MLSLGQVLHPAIHLSASELANNSDRLFTIGLGRPSMIRERDITAAKPSLLKEEEFVPWLSDDFELSADMSASRSVSNLRYMTSIFQIACPTLDEMYITL